MHDMNRNAGVLRVRAYDGSPSLTFLSVDRIQDRAVFFGIGLFLPVRRVITPLSLIAGIQVVKHERKEGKSEYGVTVRLHQGKHIKLGCRSRDQAMTIMRNIARYLGLQHRD
jgi:hypothetical protein